MLTEPPIDERLDALDQAIAEAVRARVQAGARVGPDADAIALRALLTGGMNRKTWRIVRSVLGRVEAAQGARPVVCGAAALALAADRYGTPTKVFAEADEALTAVRMGSRAILDVQGPRPWWGRLLAMPDVRVVAALPDDAQQRPGALMIARQSPGPTGDDRTFWVTDSPGSEVRIAEALGQSGLSATLLYASGGLKLFMLTGYVQAEDGRLTTAPGSLKGVIGAAPVF